MLKLSIGCLVLTAIPLSAYEPEKSGPIWCGRYPGSSTLSDLDHKFRPMARDFIDALKTAGASVQIRSTMRPPERQYLMYYSWDIASRKYLICTNNHVATPFVIPPFAPKTTCNIIWGWLSKPVPWYPLRCDFGCKSHEHSLTESMMAAKGMVQGYGLIHTPAKNSLHCQGTAIDMQINWSGKLTIKDKDNNSHDIDSEPRNGTNNALHPIGASYGLIKLVSDPPHWSITGH